VDLLRISFSFMLEERHSPIRLKKSLGGGAIADLGAYGIDLSRWLTGKEPVRVFASGHRGLASDVETNFVAFLEFPCGTCAMLDGAFDRARHNRCEIVGRAGVITITSPFIPVANTTVRVQTGVGGEDQTFPLVNPFELEFEHFSDCVHNQRPPVITPSDAVGNARVLEALQTSLETGRAVELSGSSSLNSTTSHHDKP
jgi:predicted dehydrogenase